VGIDDIRGSGLPKQQADGGGVRTIERNEIRPRLADEPGKPHLSGGIADGLCQRRGRDCHAQPPFCRPRQ